MQRSPSLCWLCFLLLANSAFALAPIPELNSPVIDTTGTLPLPVVQKLVEEALELQRSKGSQLQILLVPTVQPEDIAQYAQRAFTQWKLGREKADDGLLLLIAKDDRRVRIQVGYGLEGLIPDAIANRIIHEYIFPKFKEGDYIGGVLLAAEQLKTLVESGTLPPPAPSSIDSSPFALALLLGNAILLVLIVLVFISQKNKVDPETQQPRLKFWPVLLSIVIPHLLFHGSFLFMAGAVSWLSFLLSEFMALFATLFCLAKLSGLIQPVDKSGGGGKGGGGHGWSHSRGKSHSWGGGSSSWGGGSRGGGSSWGGGGGRSGGGGASGRW